MIMTATQKSLKNVTLSVRKTKPLKNVLAIVKKKNVKLSVLKNEVSSATARRSVQSITTPLQSTAKLQQGKRRVVATRNILRSCNASLNFPPL